MSQMRTESQGPGNSQGRLKPHSLSDQGGGNPAKPPASASLRSTCLLWAGAGPPPLVLTLQLSPLNPKRPTPTLAHLSICAHLSPLLPCIPASAHLGRLERPPHLPAPSSLPQACRIQLALRLPQDPALSESPEWVGVPLWPEHSVYSWEN